MKNLSKATICCCILMVFGACKTDKIKLKPVDGRPIASIEVADGDEAELLQQELGLEINQVRGERLYYFVKNKEQDEKLIDLGYKLKEEDLMQIYYQVMELSLDNKAPDKSKVDELRKYEIEVINKEDTYWVVRGSLEKLNKIQELKYKLRKLEKEVRPREVIIVVSTYDDIQKVSELGVDIYSSEVSKNEKITIYGGAFDYQIEKMLTMGYKVTRTK
jgi:hypothetical protein